MKILPHRLGDGRCRDCGQHDQNTAPDTCTRCALTKRSDQGYDTLFNLVRAFEEGHEMWREPAGRLQSGAIRSDQFYVFIGHNDGGSLDLPMGQASTSAYGFRTATQAEEVARALTRRYPQVWVVTTVGCWKMPKEGLAS